MGHSELANELTAMAAADLALRERLIAEGALFGGYHAEMEALHQRHAVRLAQIIDVMGWPARSIVGDEAAEAAWLIVQHAIGAPDLQRRVASSMADAVARGEADPSRWAMLVDRIAVLEGRPQTYGTQHDWDESGRLAPNPIANPDTVDDRRREVGLGPLAEHTASLRARAEHEGDRPPADWQARRAEMEAWARRVGWR